MLILFFLLLCSPIQAQGPLPTDSMLVDQNGLLAHKMENVLEKLQKLDSGVDYLPFLRVMTHHLGHLSETPIYHTTEGKHRVNVCLNLSHTADYHHRKRIDEFMSPFVHKDPDSFAFMTMGTEPQWENLLDTIASIHATAFTHPILVFAYNLPPDALSHLSMISFVEVIPMSKSDFLNGFDRFRYPFEQAMRRHSLVFYLPVGRILATNSLCHLDHNTFPFISQSNPLTHITTRKALNNLLYNGDFNQMTIPNDPGRHEQLYGNSLSCILTLRTTLPPPGPHALAV